MKTNFALAKPFNLQMFASGDNNNLGVRTYMPQFKELLTAVFGVQAYFDDFFAGGVGSTRRSQELCESLFGKNF